ncbi:MAG: hypothetical protein PHU47_00480 [Candidatus ainarchaeum sp.]|jgi:hypothetical protein|nr:hypothetical protein [Candidatus ainarchaeum sp.]
MKIVLDSGILIGFSQTCFLPLMPEIKSKIGELIITTGVKYECIDRVRNNMKFKLSSLRIEEYINEFVFTVVSGSKELNEKTNRILNLSNSIFSINNNPLHLVDFGEAECLALLGLTNADCLAIDERTTRMLVEAPEALLEVLKRKYRNKSITLNSEKYEKFQQEIGKVTVIRSVDLFSYAYEQKLIPEYMLKREFLKSALYSLKFNGCSVSFEEIDEYVNQLGQ